MVFLGESDLSDGWLAETKRPRSFVIDYTVKNSVIAPPLPSEWTKHIRPRRSFVLMTMSRASSNGNLSVVPGGILHDAPKQGSMR